MGLRSGALLRLLWELRSDESLRRAFEAVMYCELNVEGPDHGIEALDPNFVPIAFVRQRGLLRTLCLSAGAHGRGLARPGRAVSSRSAERGIRSSECGCLAAPRYRALAQRAG